MSLFIFFLVSLRQVSRLFTRRSIDVFRRGYAEKVERSLDEMSFTFAGANQVFYDAKVVKQVDVPSFSGNFGILPRHVPTLAVLKPGVVSVYETDGKVNKIFVSSGTITINDDSSVQILAEEACSVEDIDGQEAKSLLSKAQQELSSASTDVAKAEAQIAIEVAEALVSASA